MARPRKAHKAAAARARVGKVQKKMVPNDEEPSLNAERDSDSDIECTGWTGDISHVLSDSEDDEDWEDADSEDTEDSEEFESDEDSDEDFDLKCKPGATDCCAKRILDLQPDFQEQKSLVQEVIEAAGHLCIFLLKFHCELSFIELFWGAVKRYLWENCDDSFTTLQENMPKALASVSVETIWKWEHWMKQWMEAYGDGLGAKDAQIQVKKFSSKRYTSHRRIPEHVAAALDA